MAKYKIGDLVRVVAREYGHEFDIGSIVTITKLDDEGSLLPYYAEDGYGSEWWLSETETIAASNNQNNPELMTFTVGDQEFYVGQMVWATDDETLSKYFPLEVLGKSFGPCKNEIVAVRNLKTMEVCFRIAKNLSTLGLKPKHVWKFGDWARYIDGSTVFVLSGEDYDDKVLVGIKNNYCYLSPDELTYISTAEIPA